MTRPGKILGPIRSFRGLSVLITGASRGIGAAFARELAKAGARLILTARSGDKLKTLADELKRLYPTSVDVFISDLSRPESPGELFREIQKAGIPVDILINNAGFGWCGCFEEAPSGTREAMTAVNVNALAGLTHLFLPGMLARGRGGVINIASTAAFQPMPYFTLYAASKAFVLSFSEALWAEYKDRGIRVLCFCPGNTKTDFHPRAGIAEKEIFFCASAEDAVRFGMKVFLDSRQPTAIHGWTNRFLALGYRILPRAWLVLMTGLIFNRKRER
jgi:short-subunit dehydrogenase